MTAFPKQPGVISTQGFSKPIRDDAVCREEEHENIGYLAGTEILIRSELRVHRVWL